MSGSMRQRARRPRALLKRVPQKRDLPDAPRIGKWKFLRDAAALRRRGPTEVK